MALVRRTTLKPPVTMAGGAIVAQAGNTRLWAAAHGRPRTARRPGLRTCQEKSMMTFWGKALLIFTPSAQNHPKGKPLTNKELQERPLGLWAIL